MTLQIQLKPNNKTTNRSTEPIKNQIALKHFPTINFTSDIICQILCQLAKWLTYLIMQIILGLARFPIMNKSE
jgi:hypothetical protein